MATHNPRHTAARLALAGAFACVLGFTGCQHGRDGGTIYGESFSPDGEPRAVDRFVQVQSAAAARTDATFGPEHFDGRGSLNSLGRHKLDLMLHDDDAAPLVVYLNLPAAGSVAGAVARADATDERGSVLLYLSDRGVAESQVEFRDGPNVAYSHPAADGLRGLKKLESDTAAPASPDASAAQPGPANGKSDMSSALSAH